MIADPEIREGIASDWNVVRKLLSSGLSRASPSGWTQESRPSEYYNLPFILAYAVLDQVLNELINQDVFQCKSWMLGKKLEASRVSLSWQDYDMIEAGKNARNSLAHEAQLLSETQCRTYIECIERELHAWRLL